jgi:hypothetical protein
MPAYNVYLASLGGTGLDSAAKNAVQVTLLGWFSDIIVGPGVTSSGAQVRWVDSDPGTIQNTELLIYFVRSSLESIVSSLPGYRGGGGTGDGLTAWAGSQTASEVYVSNSRSYLAEMAFHEAMHNKLHLGDSALHALDGLARSPVAAGQRPSANNITRMRAALSREQPQWTGGWSAFNDPLRGI